MTDPSRNSRRASIRGPFPASIVRIVRNGGFSRRRGGLFESIANEWDEIEEAFFFFELLGGLAESSDEHVREFARALLGEVFSSAHSL